MKHDFTSVDWKLIFKGGISLSVIMTIISFIDTDINLIFSLLSGLMFPFIGLMMVFSKLPPPQLRSPTLEEAAQIIEEYQLKKSRQTEILTFEIVEPTNEFETKGELLHKSVFGEYMVTKTKKQTRLEHLKKPFI